MNKSFFVLICIIVACSKDVDPSPQVNNTTQESPTEQQDDNSNNQDNTNQSSSTTTQVPFTSRSERYSAINETTGYFKNQNNFFKYTNDSIARSLNYRKSECSIYVFSTSDQVTYDFNNDGFLDSVGFIYNSDPCESGFTHGKKPGLFAVYDNFYNERTVQYFETDLRWVAGGFELNDMDGDGDFEIVVWNWNRHESQDFPLKDISILDIDSNLNLLERQLDFTGYDFHNGSSGDIDNDGDIDLIKWSHGSTILNQKFPKILINDGSGNFTEEQLLENQQEHESQYLGGWATTVNDLFDLNGDGFLDIVAGLDFGDFEPMSSPVSMHEYYANIVILWGSDSGNFNTNKITILNDSNYRNTLQLHAGSVFTDYDLVPEDVNSWAWDGVNNQYVEFLDNLYWENVGGRFEIRKEN